MGPKMIAFTAFIMLFVLSFAAFIVSLVKEVDGTTTVIKNYAMNTRASFNASVETNSTIITA
jgi:ABC-type spermidine/putrescine transport system permease subunit II